MGDITFPLLDAVYVGGSLVGVLIAVILVIIILRLLGLI